MSAKIYRNAAARQQAYRDRIAARRKAAWKAGYAAACNHAQHQQPDPICTICISLTTTHTIKRSTEYTACYRRAAECLVVGEDQQPTCERCLKALVTVTTPQRSVTVEKAITPNLLSETAIQILSICSGRIIEPEQIERGVALLRGLTAVTQNQIPITVEKAIAAAASSNQTVTQAAPVTVIDAETVSKMFVAEVKDEEQEGRAKPKYHVVLEIEGSRLETMSKKAKEAFGDSLKAVEKVTRLESRSDRLGMAEALFQDAQGIVEELKDELEEWRDSIPESLQSGEKASDVENAIEQLEELESSLNDISFENVEFPSMY